MNFKHSLFTLATALCFGWLTVGCQEEVITEVEPKVVTEATKKSSLNNVRLVDSTLVYDLSISVSRFSGGFNDPIKEAKNLLNQFTGTLTLTAVDSIFTVRLPVNPISDNVDDIPVIYTGSYVFTDAQGETFEREARVLGNRLLNPRSTTLQILDLPNAGDPRLRFFEVSEDFSDFSEGVNKGDFSINQQGDERVLNYSADFRGPDTPFACGAEFVTSPSFETEVVIRPGDRFAIGRGAREIPGLARVEYRLEAGRARGGGQSISGQDVFIGTATGGDFGVPFQGPRERIPIRFQTGNFVRAYLYNEANERLGIRLAFLLQDGKRVRLFRREPVLKLTIRDGETVVDTVQGRTQPSASISIQTVDEDGLIREYEDFSILSSQAEQLSSGVRIALTYTAECNGIFDAVFFADNIEGGNGAVGVSVNGGPIQRVSFEEFAQDDDFQVAVTAAVALNLRAGENTVVVTSLEDRPTDLFRVSVAKAPQAIH